VVDNCFMQFRWKRQRTEIEGGPVAWDYSHAGKRRLIRVTPTLLGEEKPPFQTRRSRVIRRLLSLADRRAGSSGPAAAILEQHLIFAPD
jgi:hypothetical protein